MRGKNERLRERGGDIMRERKRGEERREEKRREEKRRD